MNVFEFRDRVVGDYERYVEGFINIRDGAIDEKVRACVKSGQMWPDPIIQLNPSFERSQTVADLVADGTLHPKCAEIFAIENGTPFSLYRHQVEAVRRAREEKNYVLTTGTGSGKSLTYIVPIVDHILRVGSGNGVKAIIVYPMNALANSQQGELEKFLKNIGEKGDGPTLTFARYTGQEGLEEKNKIRENPPDVILTNYMMLELILTRASEVPIVKSFKSLRFFVLDELHSYRGRQGADVALLTRRLREASGSKKVICVGTSATLASGGTRAEGSKEVASVATRIFGARVAPEDVVNEYLKRTTSEIDVAEPSVAERLRAEIEFLAPLYDSKKVDADDFRRAREFFKPGGANGYSSLLESKLASWIESTFGICREEESGVPVRCKPCALRGEKGAARELAEALGWESEAGAGKIADAVEFLFLLGAETLDASGRPFFTFRLHQFVTRGDAVYATAELGADRKIYMRKQIFAPDSDRQKRIYPLVFCNSCGQEFYCVRKEEDADGAHYEARDPFDPTTIEKEDRKNIGYLYISEENPWPETNEGAEFLDRLPEDWKIDGEFDKAREGDLPTRVCVDKLGRVAAPDAPDGVDAAFVPYPFRMCPNCGASYSARSAASRGSTRGEASRVSGIGLGGRSSSTTILALSCVRRLCEEESPGEPSPGAFATKDSHKLLSFTDNRQDASLQSGHLNDFVEIGVFRGALYRALKNAPGGCLKTDELAEAVVKELGLDFKQFALNPENVKGHGFAKCNAAFRDLVLYRVLSDLKRGWRLVAPNLEQTGLLRFEYEDLEELASDEEEWLDADPILLAASPEVRRKILETLFTTMRRKLALDHKLLRGDKLHDFVEGVKRQIKPNWGFDDFEDEKTLRRASFALTRGLKGESSDDYAAFSAGGGFGTYLQKAAFGANLGKEFDPSARERIIADLFRIASGAYGMLAASKYGRNETKYQLNTDRLIWVLGDGTLDHYDPITQLGASREGESVNEFYQAYYQEEALENRDIYAREHTAQIASGERERREEAFRKCELPILFCSPTMELGVDISSLNVVHMRNVPPTPANYAQRGGRAGRNGQSALVLTYGSALNQHDRYYLDRPEKLVSGAVQPPQIDLGNEDLVLSHARAIWLSEAARGGLSFEGDMKGVFDIANDNDETVEVTVRDEIIDALRDPDLRRRAAERARRAFADLLKDDEWTTAEWFDKDFIEKAFTHLEADFERACSRWKELYMATVKQGFSSNKIIFDSTSPQRDVEDAKRRHKQASEEKNILLNRSGKDGKGDVKSEFYPYRYFAAEGFLPGYNFPRLPVLAYLPGATKTPKGDLEAEYLSRPRFLAISEFGPKAIVYHNGSKYMVDRISIPIDSEENASGPTPFFHKGKVCSACGYYHDLSDGATYDVCDACGAELSEGMTNLIEMRKASARRRYRINCDEEERARFGYNIITTYRFARRDGGASSQKGTIYVEAEDGTRATWGEMTYGASATIYRINTGYRSQKEGERKGFHLNLKTGQWLSAKAADELEDLDEEELEKTAETEKCPYAIPYVHDTKNCLALKPASWLKLDLATTASLQAALSNAICRAFALEGRELAAFALPDDKNRKIFLFHEAAEGGAGVLRRLLNPNDFRRVITEALALCHFNPETGEDRAREMRDPCDAACYDCLMSYSNQRDHELLDRKLVRDILLRLKGATLEVSSTSLKRDEQFAALEKKCESELEKKWLALIKSLGVLPPTHAQYEIPEAHTRPDFVYRDGQSVAIYVDGPPHDKLDQKLVDQKQQAELEDRGWFVFRFHHQDDWRKIVESNPDVFKKS